MLRTGFETTNRKEGRRLLGLTVRMAASNSLNAFRFIVAMLPLWRFPGSLYGKALSDAFWCRSKQLFCTEPSNTPVLFSSCKTPCGNAYICWRHSLASVSYTHLTLPTNREV